MRERLIELIKSAPYVNGTLGDYFNKSYIDNCIVEHLLANGVIVPPCKVGDMVYFVARNGGRPIGIIDEIEIVQIAKTKDGFNAKGRFKGNLNEFEIRSFAIDNYSFYLAKEEAEAALRKEGARE